jgi:hypothetical protein
MDGGTLGCGLVMEEEKDGVEVGWENFKTTATVASSSSSSWHG